MQVYSETLVQAWSDEVLRRRWADLCEDVWFHHWRGYDELPPLWRHNVLLLEAEIARRGTQLSLLD